jgi:putative holliday junction resolvase
MSLLIMRKGLRNSVEQSLFGRILALDLGRRRIGLAVSDPFGWTAQGLPTLERTNIREDLARLAKLAGEREITRFLVGNPINMGGSEGRQSSWVRSFARDLKKRTGLPVEFWDERLTSREAERVLRQGGASIAAKRAAVDRLSAVILLQSYLDAAAAHAPDTTADSDDPPSGGPDANY